jgi:hypothetical protein
MTTKDQKKTITQSNTRVTAKVKRLKVTLKVTIKVSVIIWERR